MATTKTPLTVENIRVQIKCFFEKHGAELHYYASRAFDLKSDTVWNIVTYNPPDTKRIKISIRPEYSNIAVFSRDKFDCLKITLKVSFGDPDMLNKIEKFIDNEYADES